MENNTSSRMKLLIAVFLTFCLVLAFGLTGCGSSQENTAPAEVETEQSEETLDNAEDLAEGAEETVRDAVQEDASASQESKDKISEKKALKQALKDAGFDESEVEYITVKFDIDDGREIYEVEFTKDNVEYNYDIDAYTGKIVDKDVDRDDD